MKVFSEYDIHMSPRKEALYPDLTILRSNMVKVIAQFKYEPDHGRVKDFRPSKFKTTRRYEKNVVSWKGVTGDLDKIRKCVDAKKAEIGYAFFIDEGRRFYGKRQNDLGAASKWEIAGWPDNTVVLISRFE